MKPANDLPRAAYLTSEADDNGYEIDFAEDADVLDLPDLSDQVIWTRFKGDDLGALIRSAHLFLDQFEVTA